MMNLQKDKWEKIKLGDLCEMVSGGTPRRNVPEYFNGNIPWLKSGELAQGRVHSSEEFITEIGMQNSAAKLLPVNTVLIAMYGVTAGLSGILKFQATTNQAICGLLPNEKFDAEFLYAYLSSKRNYFLSRSVGTAQPNISKSIIRNLEIPLPPIDEQERIAALFRSIEQAIFHAEGQEKNLKSLQKALSNGLVNSPPVFGNLLAGKTSEVFKTSEVCECVEEHDRTPLEHGLTRFVGLEHIEPENFTVQGFGNIADGTTFTKRFARGDVLFGKRRAYLKKVAVADFDGICSSDILVFRAIKARILPELLPYYVSSDAFMNHAVSTSAGSLSPRTKWKDLAGFQLALPDMQTQEKMVAVFNQLSQSLRLLSQQKETLKTLKQKLLNEILG